MAPERWIDNPGKLGELLRALPPAEGLTAAELARVRWRLAKLGRPRPRRWAARDFLIAFAVLVGGSTAFAEWAHPEWRRPVTETLAARLTAPPVLAQPKPRRSVQPSQTAPLPPPAAQVETEEARPLPSAPRQSSIARESAALQKALGKLRRERDPRSALALLDAYQAEFPRGELGVEAAAARVDALLLLGRRGEALKLLGRLPLERSGRRNELLLLRAELQAEGDCQAALADFDTLLASSAAPSLAERALYGRAACRLRLGDSGGGRTDLDRYLERYPHGRFAERVRARLASP